MAINLQRTQAVIRENRLKSIVGYKGSIKDLVKKSKEGCLKNSKRCFSQTTSCSSGCAQFNLSLITDAAVVNHAPIGCVGDTAATNFALKWGQKMRGHELTNLRIVNTNMTEGSTVFGGSKRLKDGVREAYRRFNPKAIFVTTSCASGIIGDDIDSILQEIEEEINVPVIPVYCEGFKSQLWASGFDAAFHALLTRVVKPPEKKRSELINVINFTASGGETLKNIFARLGLIPQFVAPFSSIEEISKMSEAAATISICGTLGGYLGNGLEQKYGVPYVKALQPHGIAGMDSWLRSLGKIVGKEKEVETYIAESKERIASDLAEIKEKLKGKRVVVGMGPSFSHNYIRLLQELGLEVVWGMSWHYDAKHDDGECPQCSSTLSAQENDIPVSVSDQQNHEILNLLTRLKPDLYIGRHGGLAVWPTKMGIPSIMVNDEYVAFGYDGTIDFGYRIVDTLTNTSLVRNISKRVKLPYTKWWFEQDPFKFLESEAK